MATKLVLNRREGVVAAQDVHLNRSVYSQPLVYSVREDLSTDSVIKFTETTRLAPKATVKERVFAQISGEENSLGISANTIFAINILPTIKENIVVSTSDLENSLSVLAEIVYAQISTPQVLERVVSSTADVENSLIAEHYFNTIILDNFKDNMSFQPIKFKEMISEPKN